MTASLWMNAQAAYAGSGAAQITLHVTQQRRQCVAEQMWVALFQVLEKERLRHVGELAVVDQVLHQLLAVAVEGMENTVVDAVELQRRDIEQFAELLVEGRRRLDPAPVQKQLRIAVH